MLLFGGMFVISSQTFNAEENNLSSTNTIGGTIQLSDEVYRRVAEF